MTKRYAITPGSMGAARLAQMLFGGENVVVGEWPGPVFVRLGPDEVEPATELLAEQDLTLTEVNY